MKKLFLISGLLLLMAGGLRAQAYDNVIKTSPIGLAFGNFNATFERVISESSSVLISANYFYQFLGVDVNTVGVRGAYRYYFTHKKKDVPTGFYVNPQIGASFGSSDDVSYGSFSIGAEVGYQWAWDSGFVLDLGIGPNYTNLTGDFNEIGFDASGGSAILPSITVAIGYAF